MSRAMRALATWPSRTARSSYDSSGTGLHDLLEIEQPRVDRREVGLEVAFVAVEERFAASVCDLPHPVLAVERLMTSPWEQSNKRGPIGRPPPVKMPAGVE